MNRLHTRIVLLMVGIFLAGCAGRSAFPPPQTPRKPPEQQSPMGKVTPLPGAQQPQVVRPTRPNRPQRPLPPSKPKQISSSAVMALLGRADTEVRSGQLSRAAAILQRALNIEPRNPFIYQRLAAVRLAQQQYGQAETLAYKSNSLAVNNPFIQADNWVLIAESRRMRGDQAGRSQAMAKVKRLRLQSAALK